MTKDELAKLQRYMRRLFRLDTIEVRARPKKSDSAEVYIGDEFVGILFRDEEDDDSYQFQMAILDVDLEE